MSRGTRYTDEFKREAVNQVTVHGYSVNDVADIDQGYVQKLFMIGVKS
ncbi:transposase [Glaciecola siphonariae]|uniref:Transposase n=1 Tax=Glaciecola siphonariae TaxID=521012 RepID=A0ABV9LQZ4_9ALTE